ncbi:MAG: putative metal-binding motif-containing protein, partial [Myxococcota bacterium]
MRGWLIAAFVAGCSGDDEKPPVEDEIDADLDGYDTTQDCDDADPLVHPNQVDAWYDGVDSDCGGDDDFDQDADGHPVPDAGGDDCDDRDPAVSPSTAEVPYDGIDQDCDPATPDDDLDGDGFGFVDDCDDTDPGRSPVTLETLDDGHDDDCDGQVDLAPWGVDDLSFLGPGSPSLVTVGDQLVLAVLATQASYDALPDLAEYTSPGLLVPLDPHGVNGAPIAGPVGSWWGKSDPDPTVDVGLAVVDDLVYTSVSWLSSVNDYGYYGVRATQWVGGPLGWFSVNPSYRKEVFTEWTRSGLWVADDGEVWVCASGVDSLAYLRADGTLDAPGAWLSGVDGSGGCAWTGPSQVTTLDAAGAAATWDIDPLALAPPSPSADAPFADGPWRSIRVRSGRVIALPTSGGMQVFDGPSATQWLDPYTVLDADLAVDGDTTWVAAVVDRGY